MILFIIIHYSIHDYILFMIINSNYIRLVQEVYQVFNEYVSHTVRIYSSGQSTDVDVEGFVEINSTIGINLFLCFSFFTPYLFFFTGVLPENKELIVRYFTNLNNYDTNPYTNAKVLVHYTDENGYTTVPRYTYHLSLISSV
jgi:hypothetical protein